MSATRYDSPMKVYAGGGLSLSSEFYRNNPVIPFKFHKLKKRMTATQPRGKCFRRMFNNGFIG